MVVLRRAVQAFGGNPAVVQASMHAAHEGFCGKLVCGGTLQGVQGLVKFSVCLTGGVRLEEHTAVQVLGLNSLWLIHDMIEQVMPTPMLHFIQRAAVHA